MEILDDDYQLEQGKWKPSGQYYDIDWDRHARREQPNPRSSEELDYSGRSRYGDEGEDLNQSVEDMCEGCFVTRGEFHKCGCQFNEM